MPPKNDPSVVVECMRHSLRFYYISSISLTFCYEYILTFHSVILRVTGGEIGNPSALAPKIGPLGLVSLFDAIIFQYLFSFPRLQKRSEKILPRLLKTIKVSALL